MCCYVSLLSPALDTAVPVRPPTRWPTGLPTRELKVSEEALENMQPIADGKAFLTHFEVPKETESTLDLHKHLFQALADSVFFKRRVSL